MVLFSRPQQHPASSSHRTQNSPVWLVEPYLHVEADTIYNPITNRSLSAADSCYTSLHALLRHKKTVQDLPPQVQAALLEHGWLVDDGSALSQRFYLKYVSLETHTICNQACYFCPVSIEPRVAYFMPMDMYANILDQLTVYCRTIEAVFLFNYNEPTVDVRFVDQIRLLKSHQLPPAVNTNGSGLVPKTIDALLEMGGLAYLSVNLSTLNRQRYVDDRQYDHLEQVLRNLDYAKDRPVAQRMDIAVLGRGDADHARDFADIQRYFADSRFQVRKFVVMDRAGHLSAGLKPASLHRHLYGCENLGSRPLQHLHITPTGKCVLCCEDYNEQYVIGDVATQTVPEVLTGPAMAQLRRWSYGHEEAPDDFLCRKCIFARTKKAS